MTLYDFLFIDHDRVRSLYSQLFSGLLGAIEDVAAKSAQKTTSGQIGGDPFGNARHERQTQESESRLERLDPHDLILRDVLAGLSENDFICPDPSKAIPGNLVLLLGELTLLNFETMDQIVQALPEIVGDNEIDPSLPKHKRKQAEKEAEKAKAKGIAFMKSVSRIVPWSIQVIMDTADILAWGAIKQEHLRASPGNLLLNHGPSLQGEWYMLAIVDVVEQPGDRSPLGVLPPHVIQKISRFPEALSGLIQAGYGIQAGFGRPSDQIGVTPLLIFRKLTKPNAEPRTPLP